MQDFQPDLGLLRIPRGPPNDHPKHQLVLASGAQHLMSDLSPDSQSRVEKALADVFQIK